jgi:hypothetical protein
MNIENLLTDADRRLIERAGAHAVPEDLLTPGARWAHGVDDLFVARLILALERGAEMHMAGNGRWYAPEGSGLNGTFLSTAIREMIRTGLVVHHHTGALIPAPVHFAAWNATRWVSACRVVGEARGPKRVRIHQDKTLIDCRSCLDQL